MASDSHVFDFFNDENLLISFAVSTRKLLDLHDSMALRWPEMTDLFYSQTNELFLMKFDYF